MAADERRGRHLPGLHLPGLHLPGLRRRAAGAAAAQQPSPPAPSMDRLAEAEGRAVLDLLREVAEFRLALETDLTIAAAAAEADAPAVASSVVDADVLDLRALEDRALRGLSDAQTVREQAAADRAGADPRGPATDWPDPQPDVSTGLPLPSSPAAADGAGGLVPQPRPATGRLLRRGLATHTGPLLGVALAVGLIGGLAVPHLSGQTLRSATGAADDQFTDLSKAVGAGDDAGALAAADRLHASVSELIDRASTDPEAAHEAARLLQAEGIVLRAAAGPDAPRMRAQMGALVQRLERAAGPLPQLVQDSPTAAQPGPRTAAPAAQPSPSPDLRGRVGSLLPTLRVPAPTLPVSVRPVPSLGRRSSPADLPLPTGSPLVPSGVASPPAPFAPVAPAASGPATPSPSASASAEPSTTPETTQQPTQQPTPEPAPDPGASPGLPLPTDASDQSGGIHLR